MKIVLLSAAATWSELRQAKKSCQRNRIAIAGRQTLPEIDSTGLSIGDKLYRYRINFC